MSCPSCGCKVTYQYDDEDEPFDERLERCAACGEVFDIDDHADEDDEWVHPPTATAASGEGAE